MAAEDRSGWPVLSLVRDLEGRNDESAERLRAAEAVIAAIREWTRVTQDPAAALAEIGRLVELHHNQQWAPVSPQAEASRVRRVEDGGPDA